jgi:hypothetical protein
MTYKNQYYNIINQPQNTPELMIKAYLLQNSLWKTFINQIEEFEQIARYHRTLAVSYDDSVVQPLTNDVEEMEANQKIIVENGLSKVKILQDAYTELKKKRELYKEAQDIAKEAAEIHNKGLNTYNIRDKEMEKLTLKYQASLEKVNHLKDSINICEDICKKQQEQYYFSDLPVVLENLKSKEEERCHNLKKLFIEANKIEKLSIQYIVNINNSVGEVLKDIDVSGDIEDFTHDYMYSFNHDSDISVRSLINPEKAGRMDVHKDIGSMEWKSRYFVLMSKHFRLYCFESEDSEKPKEIIDLNNVSIHLLDDSYFNLSNSFQIVVYNNIKEKTRKKVFSYYFVAESSLDREEWFSHIRDVAYCCQTCNITKMILYEYNQKINGRRVNYKSNSVFNRKNSEISDGRYSRINSESNDSETDSFKTPTSHRDSNSSNNYVNINDGNEQINTTSITEQIKKSFESISTTSETQDKLSKVNKSLITFEEALGDPLVFLNSDSKENNNKHSQSGKSSQNTSELSLTKILCKSPVESQKSFVTSNQHDDQTPLTPSKNTSFVQVFHEHGKDKRQNRYSTSFIEFSKLLNNTNMKRETSSEISTGNTIKKDSSFFKLIKNNAKNINLFNSTSDENIDNFSKDISSGTIQSTNQNCHYSIISNISPSKISQYSIPTVNSSSDDDLYNLFEYLNNKNKYTIKRSIKLFILEARNLCPNEKKKNLEFCTYIFFDDIVQGKTLRQPGTNPFWGEEFNFENVSPCLNNIHLVVCQQHRVSNDAEIGHIVIPINKLHSNKKVEEWIPLIPLSNTNNDNFNSSIRVSVTLIDEHILPNEDYSEFIDYILQPSLEPVIKLGNVVQQREEFAKTLLYILMDRNKEIDGIKTLVSHEIKNTDDPNIIFRGNSLTTKIIDQYMKLVGSRYLNNTLRRQIQNVYNLKESCEVDPTKIDKSEDIKKHWKKLLAFVNSFWESIRQSISKCPSKLKEIFSYTKTEVSKTFENETVVPYFSISGFIFLRFFCPAILSPKLFGLSEQHPDPVTARTLTLIAKILQNLANLTEFASKEPHMSESNNFIKNHISEMKYFIDAISISPDKEEENAIVEYDVRSQYEKLYRFYRSNSKSCFSKNDPDDKKMLDIVQNISNIHIKYREDLFNYQISSEDKSIRKILNNSEVSLYDVLNKSEEELDKGNKEPETYNGHIKKELSNYLTDEYTKSEMDDSLQNILFTIRRFSTQYNKKDTTKRQNTINKKSLNQYSPFIDDLYNTNQKASSSIYISPNNNNDNNNYKLEDYESKSVYSNHSLLELNASNGRLSASNSRLNASNNKLNASSLNELNISSNKLNANSRNSLNTNSSNSLHSNSSNIINSHHNMIESDNNNNENSKEDESDHLISLTEGLNLMNNHTNNPVNKKNKNVNVSRQNSTRSNHFIKIFTNVEGGTNNYSSVASSPVASPEDSYYTLSSGGDENCHSAQYSPNSKKRFPLKMKRKISMTLNSLTGSHSTNIHRDHGKVTRDY